jgi:hypothetical protein
MGTPEYPAEPNTQAVHNSYIKIIYTKNARRTTNGGTLTPAVAGHRYFLHCRMKHYDGQEDKRDDTSIIKELT